MPRTYGKRKQQTRLTFAPVVEVPSPTSGPDGAHSSPLRPAKLRYSQPSSASSSSPSRRRLVKGQLQLEDYSAASNSRRNASTSSNSSDEVQDITSSMYQKALTLTSYWLDLWRHTDKLKTEAVFSFTFLSVWRGKTFWIVFRGRNHSAVKETSSIHCHTF